METLRDAAVSLARGAGDILRRCYSRGAQVTPKGVVDLVTDADRASEEYIIEGIRKRFPDHAIVAEESGRSPAAGPFRWVIDPLDGTINFAHQVPHFCVIIAVQEAVHGGGGAVAHHDAAGAVGEATAMEAAFVTRVGVVFDPLRDELFVAAQAGEAVGGGGAAQLNGAPIRVSQTARLIDSLLATGFSYERLWIKQDNHAEFCRLNLLSQGVRRFGSAGLDLAYVACGRYDAFWEYGLNPWDLAAGVLLVQQAGGCVTLFGGAPHTSVEQGSLVASNKVLHAPLLAALASSATQPVNSRRGLASHLPEDVARRVGLGESTR